MKIGFQTTFILYVKHLTTPKVSKSHETILKPIKYIGDCDRRIINSAYLRRASGYSVHCQLKTGSPMFTAKYDVKVAE